jgi:DNA-binding transcriptional LysR family regulator
MPTLLQLKSFLAVVDEGGFTAASQRLGLTQPAVSRAVSTLEKELGLPLLVRGREGLSLTDAGSRALAHARAAVQHLTLLRTELAKRHRNAHRSAAANLHRPPSGGHHPVARRQ